MRFAWALVAGCLLASAAHAADAKAPGVTVTGSGNVGIGSMSGGQINIGLRPDEVQALQKATAKEAVALLAPILTRINAQIAQHTGTAREDKIALGVAEAFLATIKGKKIPTSDWSVEFGEAARNYLRLGASIEATPVTSDRIKVLVGRADTARKLGQFDQADTALSEAADLATQDAQRIQQQALASTRQAASLYASRANLAFTRLERSQGASLLEKAFELRKGDVSGETIWWLFNAGDAWLTEGQSGAALRAYMTAKASAEAALAGDPRNTQWQRDLSVSYDRIGDVQAALGDSAAALKSFQAGLAIAEGLAAGDPRNTQWQRDLSVSYNKIGNVQAAQGDSAAALKSFQAGLAIAERLAAGDPRNTQWQRDVATSCWKLASLGEVGGSVQARRVLLQHGLGILTAQRDLGQLPALNAGWIRQFEDALQKLK